MPASSTRRTYSEAEKRIVLNILLDKESKIKKSTITKWTGMSIRTQERILKNYSQHNNVSSPKASRKGYKNPNSKITEGFQDELLKSVEKYPSLGDRERSYYLSNKLNQKITPRMVSYWRSKGRITRKIAKVLFTERYTKEHLQQKHDFLKTMHPYTGKQTFLESMSTDESGFYLNATRKYAYSKVSYVRGKIF